MNEIKAIVPFDTTKKESTSSSHVGYAVDGKNGYHVGAFTRKYSVPGGDGLFEMEYKDVGKTARDLTAKDEKK